MQSQGTSCHDFRMFGEVARVMGEGEEVWEDKCLAREVGCREGSHLILGFTSPGPSHLSGCSTCPSCPFLPGPGHPPFMEELLARPGGPSSEMAAGLEMAGGAVRAGRGAGRNPLSPTNGLRVLQLLEPSASSCLLTSCLRSILGPNTLSAQRRKGFPFMSLLRIAAYVSVILMGGKTSGCWGRAWRVESKRSSGNWNKVSPALSRVPPDHPRPCPPLLEALPPHSLRGGGGPAPS